MRFLTPGATVAALLVGCNPNPLPGDMLGTYAVAATTQTNTCGAGLQAPATWNFKVQLSEDGQTLYWSWMNDTTPLSSPLDAESHASLTTSQSANVDGTSDGGLGPCTMDRSDDVEITLASGSPPATFTATIAYGFSVPAGSTCDDQLSAAGGTYAALPCNLTYTATGTRQ